VAEVNVRAVLIQMLDGEQREVEIREHAIASLSDDAKAQRYEGFKLRAESTEKAIERHTGKRDRAKEKVAALTAAIEKFPKEAGQ
jgi:hypothetical protein